MWWQNILTYLTSWKVSKNLRKENYRPSACSPSCLILTKKFSVWVYSRMLESIAGCHTMFLFAVLQVKLVSAIFYQFFIFSSNDTPAKTMKNVFYFMSQSLFVLEIFKFLYFFPLLSTLSRFKRVYGSGIIYDVMNWRA